MRLGARTHRSKCNPGRQDRTGQAPRHDQTRGGLAGWRAGKRRGAYCRVSCGWLMGDGWWILMDALMKVDFRRQHEDEHLTA